MTYLSRLALLLCLVSTTTTVSAQRLLGVSIRWEGDFTEWIIYTEADSIEGLLEMRWHSLDPGSEWEYELGDIEGTIRRKFRGDDIWELDSQHELITIRPSWSGDSRSWKVTDNDISIIFETKWGNRTDEWITHTNRFGVFYMYTVWENDPRDWEFRDDLREEVPVEFRIAMMFIALYNTLPN